jgi:BirA family transcriptional regulator, biotin operon repressor / biotin---[acetyl-CoA-carboxylase] ligase
VPLAIAYRIETFESLPSTQAEVRRRLDRDEDVDGLVVRALEQTQGRGRRGRTWTSGRGGSYQTLAVRDPQPPRLRAAASTLAVAVGLAETLAVYGVKVGIKWPNDVLYRDRKLAGVLSEYRRGHLLVGVGVNVANDVPEGATALRGWDLEGVHAVALEGVQKGLEAWWDDAGALPGRFAAYDALASRAVRVLTPDGPVEGTAVGIDPQGWLLVNTGERVVRVSSGTVVAYAAG